MLGIGLAAALWFIPAAQCESPAPSWERHVLTGLARKYLDQNGSAQPAVPGFRPQLDRLARQIGQRLSRQGLDAVPAEDLALLALLEARLNRSTAGEASGTQVPAGRLLAAGLESRERAAAPPAGHPGGTTPSGREQDPAARQPQEPSQASPGPTAASDQPSTAQRSPGQPRDEQNGGQDAAPAGPSEQQDPGRFSDIAKGDEGFRQGVEQLAELPITERLVMTGDITSGFQAATVADAPSLTSAFGRARMNFVLQAMPASPGGTLSEGYFFMQMRAAGGPFDSAPVGGPSLFSSLNDVATDRSRFNEGTSRGNIFLAKAFYQQSMKLGEGELRGRAGIINLTDYFDTNLFANNEARQFVNSAFVNSAAFKTGISAPGVMAEYERPPWLFNPPWLDGIVLRAGYAVSSTERAFTSPLWTSELELQTTVKDLEGHWRFGGSFGNFADTGSVSEFHISVDQWLSGNFGVFGRWGITNDGPGSQTFGPVNQSYSFGVQRRFVDEQERVSAWAIGFSQAFPIEPSETDDFASERVLETYYRWQLTRNVSLTPHFQLILGAGGLPSGGTHTVFGTRLFFAY